MLHCYFLRLFSVWENWRENGRKNISKREEEEEGGGGGGGEIGEGERGEERG